MKDIHSPKNETTSTPTSVRENPRRNFFKKAALGTALITTVTSRPVFAGQCNLSGNLSNNASVDPNAPTCINAGYSPGGWKHNGNGGGAGGAYKFYGRITYPDGSFINYNDSISKLLGYSLTTPDESVEPSITIREALKGNRQGENGNPDWKKNFIKHIVTAALNAALWSTASEVCNIDVDDPACVYFMDNINGDDNFYWPFTVADYRADFLSLKDASNSSKSSYANALAAQWF